MEPLNSSWQLLANTSLDNYQGQEGNDESFPAILYLMTFVTKTYFIGSLSLVGMATNIINLAVFYRQGILTESSTTTLSALAVSDFCVCFLSLWCCFLMMVDTYWDQSENSTRWGVMSFYFMTGSRPKNLFTQITCWCTAYLALERFYSVVFPFKVKEVFSAKRSCVVLTSIFLGTFCLYISHSLSEFPVWEQYNNISELVYRKNKLLPQWMYFAHIYMNAILLRILSMVVVVFCNVAIFWKVTLSQKFRKSATSMSPGIRAGSAWKQTSSTTSRSHDVMETTDKKTAGKQKDHKTAKEMTLLKMLMVICSLFIFCYIPDTVMVISFFANRNNAPPPALEDLLFGIINILEVINSTSNTFIYYNMSTRFRRDLRSLLFNAKKRPIF